jgi:predicted phosphodiesterase
MRIAVIGDVHANPDALSAALADACSWGYDELVFIGDIFTYGVEPLRTFEIVSTTIEREAAILIMGNHDWMYTDGSSASQQYFNALPDWLRESVAWTNAQLASCSYAQLPWQPNHLEGGIYFSHANPYEFGNWTYLNTEAELLAAGVALASLGYQTGVFGHTHRQQSAYVSLDSERVEVTSDGGTTIINPHSVQLINAGSPGQPRNKSRDACILLLETNYRYVSWEFKIIHYDEALMRQSIVGSELSLATRQKLLSYFK